MKKFTALFLSLLLLPTVMPAVMPLVPASTGSTLTVTDYLSEGEDVADALQRLIDGNPNRTLYFPDGSNNVMNPDRPYWECSVGIHNLFHFLRIEYIRRLSYLELPTSNKRAVKFAFEFKF